MSNQTSVTPEQILKKYWGYDSFRHIQKPIIESILSGRDTFAIMQTGGGKSICFQVPTMMASGMTVVISPLIALMKDQVDALRKKGIMAALVNGNMDKRTINHIYIDCQDGKYKFLYVSPERLSNKSFLRSILKCKVSYITIDEAHTISQWGYDFRTAYLGIKKFKDCFPNAPLIALTATANGYVQQEVVKTLSLRDGYKIITDTFARANLNIYVKHCEQKISYIANYLKGREDQTGIIYVDRRKRAERISMILREKHGLKTEFYHGGLTEIQRNKRQDNWTSDKAKVMVCTNAFGMGIDKADVRFVFHVDFPESLEAYWQEAGRAGRDGKESDAIFLYSNTDIKDHIKHEVKYPDFEQIKDLFYWICSVYADKVKDNKGFVIRPDEVASRRFADESKTLRALRILENHNYLSLQSSSSENAKLTIQLDKSELDDIGKKDLNLKIIIFKLFKMLRGKKQYHKQFRINLATWRKESNMEIAKFKRNVQKLIDMNAITLENEKPSFLSRVLRKVKPENFALRMEEVTQRKDYQQAQRDTLMSYVVNDSYCRIRHILNYFNEFDSKDCGKCDVCRTKDSCFV